MKTQRIAAWAAALLTTAGAVAFAQPSATEAKRQMEQIQQEPARVGRSIERHVVEQQRDLKWRDGPPGLPKGSQIAVLEGDPAVADRLFTVRLKFPAGYRIPPHFHPADEHITVIDGEMRIGMGERFDEGVFQAVGAGGFIALPAGHPHYARVERPTEIQLHGVGPWRIIYVNPKDDPRRGAG